MKGPALYLEVECPECDQPMQRVKLEPGKNSFAEVSCEFDGTKLTIPDVLVKAPAAPAPAA